MIIYLLIFGLTILGIPFAWLLGVGEEKKMWEEQKEIEERMKKEDQKDRRNKLLWLENLRKSLRCY